MRATLHGLRGFNDTLERVLRALLLLLLATFFVLVLYQIASRNLSALPRIYWTGEMSRFAFQWMVMLGTALGVRHADHFVLEAFLARSRLARMSHGVRELSFIAMGVLFVYYGWDFAVSGLRRTFTAAGLPMVYVYSAFVVCGALTLLFAMARTLAALCDGLETLPPQAPDAEPAITPEGPHDLR
ncbi:TRAP transporter small permease [Arhodomonas sp. AD133]|uniref:TRAP transporter small permease n=1 Tax=Arhodomonas sp. AD133 TaxID=3415009 RepID=UPI003EC139B3